MRRRSASVLLLLTCLAPVLVQVTTHPALADNPNAFNRLMAPKASRNPSPAEDGIHDPESPGTASLQAPRLAFDVLPQSNSGNYVDWVKALHGSICAEVPEDWRLCGENVYARHSISYGSLPSYFFLFSIWNGANEALSWEETLEWASLLGLETPPVFFRV